MKTDYLLHKEMECVLRALTPSNELVMRACLQTGLRVSDVLALRRDQIGNRFWVTEAKTGKRRIVGLDTPLVDAILGASMGSDWAFPGRAGVDSPRTRQAVWKDVKRAQKAFRLPQNVGTHTARKIYAVELMEKYGDIARVQKAMKHSSESITAIYAMSDILLERKLSRRRKGSPVKGP